MLGLTAPGSVAAAPQRSTAQEIDDAGEECTEAIPEQASIAGVLDDGRNVDLDVHVLLDGVSVERATDVMARAAKAYAPLKITLKTTFQEVDFPAQRTEPEFLDGPSEPTSDSTYMFQKSKDTTGGKRPVNADVVYLLSSDNITGTTAGQADCIGGVRYASRAFAIGENDAEEEGSGLFICCRWTTAKVAAHEIAHLLGAHHHYANCAEGAPAAVEDSQLLTCTVMFNDVGAVNLHFSTLEAAVVRGHVIEFADRKPVTDPPPTPRPTSSASPTPFSRPSPSASASTQPSDPSPAPVSSPTPQATAPPESDPDPVTYSRSVDFDISGRKATGRVNAGDARSCSAGVQVMLERRSRGEWSKEDAAVTRDDGSFRFRLAGGKGSYRAVVAESTGRSDGQRYTCAAAASQPARRR